jgi:predicted patatin/cPLA2 family phospholipase
MAELRQGGIPSVTDLIVERALSNSKPGERDDPYILNLAVEGGAMRGVRGAGMLRALHDQGITSNVFDGIHTTSGGGPGVAYYVAGQLEGADIYSKHINNGQFINPVAPLRRQPLVNIRHLTHKVMKDTVPLDWEKVVNSETPIHIAVTSAVDGQTVDMSNFRSQEELLQVLFMACSLPVLAGPLPVGPDGNKYLDGGVSTGGIPYDEASRDATHVLALLTKKNGERIGSNSRVEKIGARILRRNGYPQAARALEDRQQKYSNTLTTIFDAQAHPPTNPGPGNPLVHAICVPEGSQNVSMLTTKTLSLANAGIDGYRAVLDTFGPYNLPPNTEILVRQHN